MQCLDRACLHTEISSRLLLERCEWTGFTLSQDAGSEAVKSDILNQIISMIMDFTNRLWAFFTALQWLGNGLPRLAATSCLNVWIAIVGMAKYRHLGKVGLRTSWGIPHLSSSQPCYFERRTRGVVCFQEASSQKHCHGFTIKPRCISYIWIREEKKMFARKIPKKIRG